MTFKGETYQGIIDIQRLIIVAKTQLQAYKAEQKALRLKSDPKRKEIAVKINIQEKYIFELEELIEDLLDKIDILAEGMSDVESQVFLRKYITGKTYQEIMDELNISQTTYYKYAQRIESRLEKTCIGQKLLEALKE